MNGEAINVIISTDTISYASYKLYYIKAQLYLILWHFSRKYIIQLHYLTLYITSCRLIRKRSIQNIWNKV